MGGQAAGAKRQTRMSLAGFVGAQRQAARPGGPGTALQAPPFPDALTPESLRRGNEEFPSNPHKPFMLTSVIWILSFTGLTAAAGRLNCLMRFVLCHVKDSVLPC